MILVESNLVTEGRKEDAIWRINGVFMQAEAVNRNQRIYPRTILDREVNEYITEYVQTSRAVGELSHPNSSAINPDRVAILVESLRREGNDYIGEAKVLDTPCGKIIQAMLEGGVTIGVSSRGSGSVKKNKMGINEVQDDFKLHCIDAVMNPSAPKALVNAVYENEQVLENLLNDAILFEEFTQFLKAKRSAKSIANKSNREQALYEAFRQAIKGIVRI